MSSRFVRRPEAARGLIGVVAATALAAALSARVARGDEPAARDLPPATPASTPDETATAADQATTPLPIKTQLPFKPSYTFPNGSDRYKAEILFEPVLPFRAFAIPGLDANDFWSVARVQVPVVSQQNSQGVASGLGDLTFTDLVAHHVGPLDAALGFATIFPMATAPALGQGKWQIGPAAALRLAGGPLSIAALAQNLYSVAGSSQSANLGYVTVQPFVVVHLPAAMFLASDAEMDFYWAGGKTTVPVDLGVGHAFGAHFVGQLQFWYTLAGSGQGDIKGEAVLNFLP